MSSRRFNRIRRGLQSQGALKPQKRSFLLFVVLPAWLGPGLLDWWFHRRTHIEEPANGGTRESLLHSAMFAEAGLPLLLATAFEMNPLLIALMTGAAASHEATAMLDVRLALNSRRNVSQWEQHVHSFLEVMPFWIVPLMVLLNRPMTDRWSLTRRASVLSKQDLALVAGWRHDCRSASLRRGAVPVPATGARRADNSQGRLESSPLNGLRMARESA